MPSIYDLKPRFQALLRPLTVALARRGVTANQVTLLAMALSVAAGAAIAAASRVRTLCCCVVPLLLFVRMALNAIDGMLAREHDMKTPLGAVLNELGDVVSDAALVPSPRPRGRRARRAGGNRGGAGSDQRNDGRGGGADRRLPALRRPDGQERPRLRLRADRPAAGLGRGARAVARHPAGGRVRVCWCVTILNRAAKALEEIKS